MTNIPEWALLKAREALGINKEEAQSMSTDGFDAYLRIARAFMAEREATERERAKVPEWLRELLGKYPLGTQMVSPIDDLDGEIVGYYRTREGKPGLDLQQNGKRIVHVYQTKWWEQPASIRKGTHND